MRLSVGPSPAARGITTFIAVVLLVAGFCFAGLAFGIGGVFDSFSDSFGDAVGDAPGGAAGDPFGDVSGTPVDEGFTAFGWLAKAMGLCGIPFVLAAFYLLLYTWRFQMRLDGTLLTKRGALSTRRADIATAEVNMSGFNYTQRVSHNTRAVYRVAALAVTDPATHKTIKVPLRGQGLDLLPPHQLRTLADALDRNMSSDSGRARGIAARLRELASDPIAY